jgi:hypothetical protein
MCVLLQLNGVKFGVKKRLVRLTQGSHPNNTF